jgi:ribosomal-protein-alanine N-acetyltransferase
MIPSIETPRLLLRELLPTDAQDLFRLDSDPKVHEYLGKQPVKNMEQIHAVIQMVRKQYADFGIGRWAAIEKSSGAFIGWAGLKWITETTNQHQHFYDVGYRLMPLYWGKGYATEAAKAAIQYGFQHLAAPAIYGMAHVDNKASRCVLEKCGLKWINTFEMEDMQIDWLKLIKEDWQTI